MLFNNFPTQNLPCKICGRASSFRFGLPHNKKAAHPIPDEPDDTWYYQCESCDFLFTFSRDDDNQAQIYDDVYWNEQDPGWYDRVPETLRLLMMANELLRRPLESLEILDFGCGMGAFMDICHRSMDLNVWGTDIIMPKFGNEYYLEALGERKFDVITCCEVVEHFPQPMETFHLMRRHLKSPGVLAFQTCVWDPAFGRDFWYLGPHNGHISIYSRKSFEFLFAKMGGKSRRLFKGYTGVQAWLFADEAQPSMLTSAMTRFRRRLTTATSQTHLFHDRRSLRAINHQSASTGGLR